MYVRTGGRERMMDMRWPTLPRDKIYYNVLNYCVCVGGVRGEGGFGRGRLGLCWVFVCVFLGGRTL